MKAFKGNIKTKEMYYWERLLNDVSKLINVPVKYCSYAEFEDQDYGNIKEVLVGYPPTAKWIIEYPLLRLYAEVEKFDQYAHVRMQRGSNYNSIDAQHAKSMYLTWYYVDFK